VQGGELSVTSDLGEGARFTLSLPQDVNEGAPSNDTPSRELQDERTVEIRPPYRQPVR
jgi:hypothetical protein